MSPKTHFSHTEVCTVVGCGDRARLGLEVVVDSISKTEESVGSNDFPPPPRKMSRMIWPRSVEEHFIVLCYNEFSKGQLLGKSFSKTAMGRICDNLNLLPGVTTQYTVEQLLTKYKNIKKAWAKLYDLRYGPGGSGLGWDPVRRTIVGPTDVMEQIFSLHRDNASIIRRGVPYFDQLTEMWVKDRATGSFARSRRVLQDDDDVVAGHDTQTEGDDVEEPWGNLPSTGAAAGPSTTAAPTTGGIGAATGCTGLPPRPPTTAGSQHTSQSTGGTISGRKRSGSSSERDTAYAEAVGKFGEFWAHKKARSTERANRNREELAQCAAEITAMEGMDDDILYKAIRALKDKDERDVFFTLPPHLRRRWVFSLGDE